MPLIIYFAWDNPIFDDAFVAAVEESANHLSAIAQAEGLLTHPLALYGNSVNFRTPLVNVYGVNLPALQALKPSEKPVERAQARSNLIRV